VVAVGVGLFAGVGEADVEGGPHNDREVKGAAKPLFIGREVGARVTVIGGIVAMFSVPMDSPRLIERGFGEGCGEGAGFATLATFADAGGTGGAGLLAGNGEFVGAILVGGGVEVALLPVFFPLGNGMASCGRE
jgi:hypothetical protein